MRPWLSVEFNGVKLEQDLRLYVPFQNYGQTPAVNVKVRALASFDRITEGILRSKEYTPGIGMVVPNGRRNIALDLAADSRSRLASGESYLWLGILIEYSYTKGKRGEYGLIGEYNFAKGHDKTDSEWSK
jgi:hypothetical protein